MKGTKIFMKQDKDNRADKGRREKEAIKNPDNRGVTLLELVISILILVIIMIPLLNSFYQSALFDKKAKEIEDLSLLSSNIMESIKSMNLDRIKQQFYGEPSDFTIIGSAGANQSFEEKIVLRDDDDTNTYIFAIHGIKQSGKQYDAVVTMEADSFRLETDEIFNRYPMPEVINLDIMTNGITFSDGKPIYPEVDFDIEEIDNTAVNTLLSRGEEYARKLFEQSDSYTIAKDRWDNECEEAVAEGRALPEKPSELIFNAAVYPQYCDPITVRGSISKTMTIRVNQAVDNNISYSISYQCNWPAADSLDSIVSYHIMSIQYPERISNVYLFYVPSAFNNDIINVINETAQHEINFFLARQGKEQLLPNITININSADTEGNKTVKVFSNIENRAMVKLFYNGADYSGSIVNTIIDAKEKDRFYKVNIKLYKYVPKDSGQAKYQDENFSLNSSMENMQ